MLIFCSQGWNPCCRGSCGRGRLSQVAPTEINLIHNPFRDGKSRKLLSKWESNNSLFATCLNTLNMWTHVHIYITFTFILFSRCRERETYRSDLKPLSLNTSINIYNVHNSIIILSPPQVLLTPSALPLPFLFNILSLYSFYGSSIALSTHPPPPPPPPHNQQ